MSTREFKITMVTEEGESTISGTAHVLPVPQIYPTPYNICFDLYTTEGRLWDKEQEIEISSAKIEVNGQTNEIPEANLSWKKVECGEKRNAVELYFYPKK
ncbi:hypothetical protein ACTFIV_006570 [Dictyostelium citrinum]